MSQISFLYSYLILWRTPSEPCLLARRRRLQPYSASGAVWVSILTTSCLLSSLSDRFCKEKLRMSRFAKRGNTIQLRLGVRLCLFRITLFRVTLKRSPIGDTKRSLRSGDQTDLRQVSKSVRFRQYSSPRVSLSVPVRDIPASHVLSVYCLLVQLAAPTTSCPCGQKSNNTLVKLSVTESNGSIWHSPSKGPLSHPFTVYTQNLVPT